MEGVCRTIRSFAYDIIAKEAPELDETYRQKLLDEWIPSINKKPLVKNGCVNGIPSSMMLEMVWQFVRYGVGKMPKEESKALEESIGISWAKRYLNVFPLQVRNLIRAFIKDEISIKIFNEKLNHLLF